MNPLRIGGWGVVHPAGVGADPLVERLTGGAGDDRAPVAATPDEPPGYRYADFDVRRHVARKGTAFYDRATSLAVVACGQALDADDALAAVAGGGETSAPAGGGETSAVADRDRTGLVLGTTLGSFRSTSDFSRETLVQERPYLVNPVLFPNTVMNCAAGQSAIRYGLRGVNATIAGGPLALLAALRYAQNAVYAGHADVMVVGSVEEFSPHRAWGAALTSGVPAGEGAAAFVVRPAGTGTDHRGEAEILGLATGFGTPGAGGAPAALAGCVRRALDRAGVSGREPAVVLSTEAGRDDRTEYDPTVAVLGHRPERLLISEAFGDCGAAGGALALAAFLALRRCGRYPSAGVALLTAVGRDGGAGAAVVREVSRVGAAGG